MKTDSKDDGAARVLMGVILAGVPALIVTWLLVDHYPIPDNEVLILGLAGFLFVMFLDLLLIYSLIVRDFRAGQGKAAIKLSAIFLWIGLLVAPVPGFFLGLLYWLSKKPWGVWVFVAYPFITFALVSWNNRRARRASRTSSEGS
jgi:hypothetical protein